MNKLSFVAVAFILAACSAADSTDEPVGQSESAAKACRPAKKYVSRSTSQCAAILFVCEEGREPFFDSRGCGCECATAPANVCDDPARTYVSRDPAQCQLVRFSCESGQAFFDDCGCGCIN